MATPELSRVGPLEHLKWLRLVRDNSRTYHRWGTGADLRLQWKPTPASTRTKSIEGDTGPGDLDVVIERIEGDPPSVVVPAKRTIREVREGSDLRRFTVNTHPALARALAKMMAAGEKDQVIVIMAELAPGVAAKFQEITGRRCVALSVHFDSNMPHWNIWHIGSERVIYPIGMKERERFRRTAFDLNSSGNLLAWHRTRLAFERLGKDFKALSSRTVNELQKCLKRAMDRQDRPPGDWTINEEADRLLEDALRVNGKATEIEEGFAEFVENEERRYRDGGAGREPKDGRKLAVLLKDDESVRDAIVRLKRADEVPLIEKQLKPGEGETLADAAARVVMDTRALNAKLQASVTESARLKVEREQLSAERDRFKSQVDKTTSLLERIRIMFGLTPDAKIVPAVERIVGEAAKVPELNEQIGQMKEKISLSTKSVETEREKVRLLEEEITPLRILRKLVRNLIERLNKSSLAQKLDAKIKSLLGEMGNHVGEPFNPEKKREGTEIGE